MLLLLTVSVSAGAIILYTSDGGENWISEESSTVFNLNDVTISFATGTAISVGDNGTILRREEDGTWIDVSPEGFTTDLFSVAAGVSGMMACGADGTVLSSFDGGNSWREFSNFGHNDIDLYSVNFDPTHPNSFLISGENGFVFSSVDGLLQTGTSSDFVTSCGMLCSGFPELVLGRGGNCYLLDIKESYNIDDTELSGATDIVSGGSRYIAAGEKGSIYRYSDQDSWEAISSGVEEDLNDVSYIVWGLTACAVGDNGVVLVSADNGATWEIVDTGTSRDLTAVAGNGAGFACIVGTSALSGVVNSIPFTGASH